MPVGREVEDGKTAVAKPDRSGIVCIYAAVVGAAVYERIGHARQSAAIHMAGYAANAAHAALTPRPAFAQCVEAWLVLVTLIGDQAVCTTTSCQRSVGTSIWDISTRDTRIRLDWRTV